MNDVVKNCIQIRKDSIFNTYDIKNEETLKIVNDFFNRLEIFANNYDDAAQFETAFATSELNKEYMDLFTIVSSSSKVKNIDSMINEGMKNDSIAQDTVDELADSIKHRVKRDLRYEARNIPIVGDIIDIDQHIGLFGSLKRMHKNKDKDESGNDTANK